MRRRFIIAVKGFSQEQKTAVTKYLRELELGWWHYIDDIWLVTTKKQAITVDELRDHLCEMVGKSRVLVMEIPEDVTWAAWDGITANVDKSFGWLKKTWADND